MSDIEFLTRDCPTALPNWLQPIAQSVQDSLGDLRSKSRFHLNLYRWRSVLPDGPIEIPDEKDLTLPWMYAIVGAIHDASERERGTGSFGKRMTASPWPERDVKDVGETVAYEDFKRGYEFLCLQVSWVRGLKDADRAMVEWIQQRVEYDLLLHQLLSGRDDIRLSDERCAHLETALKISVLVKSLSSDELNRLKTILDRNRPRIVSTDQPTDEQTRKERGGGSYRRNVAEPSRVESSVVLITHVDNSIRLAVTESSDTEPDEVKDASRDVRTPPAADSEQPDPAATLAKPSDDAIACYRIQFITGMKQVELAKRLTTELKKPVSQGQVSRWLKKVGKWVEAGNVLPSLPSTKQTKSAAMDPETLGLGARRDGHTPRQRDKRSEDSDD